MTGTEVALVISSIATLVTAIGGFVVTLRKVDGVKAHVVKVETATNGMKAQLVDEVRKASFAKGVKSETDKAENAGTA